LENDKRLKADISSHPYFKATLNPTDGAKVLDVSRGAKDPLSPNARDFQNVNLQILFADKFYSK
jgi:hypothetical protein